MKRVYLIISLVLFTSVLVAQTINENKILEQRGEIYFSFKIPSLTVFYELSKELSVDAIDNGIVYAYANQNEFQNFLQYNLPYQVVSDYYLDNKEITMATTLEQMENWDRYPTWDLYVEMMQSYAQNYPDICMLDTIGYSVEGRALLCLVISDNIQEIEVEPKFFWTNTMHGDELVCYPLSLRFADYLLVNYGSDTQVDSLVNNIRIYINPMSNPDGTFYDSPDGSTVENSRRNNVNGVDLNRNFPTINGDPTSIEPEIQCMIDYADLHHFAMSVNTHSGAEVLNYPWDEWTSSENPHADDSWFQYTGNIYASQAIDNSPSGYFQGISDNGVIEGADWYSIDGCRQDYMMYFQNCREVTLELSTTKKLDAEELPAHWDYNRQSILDYTAQVMYGINGIITDSITGDPIKAKAFVIDHDKDNSEVYSQLPLGDYYRPIDEGTWTVRYSAPGYRSKDSIITVSLDNKIIVNIELAPLPPTVDFIANETELTCNGMVQFENLTNALPSTEYTWDFGDGEQSNETNPMHLYISNGSYTVSLYAINEYGEDELIKSDFITINLPDFSETINGYYCSESENVAFTSASGNPVNYYLNINDLTPVCTGISCLFEDWNESSTCFAEEIISGITYNVGLADNSDGGAYNMDNEEHFLEFDCDVPLILDSVTVYAQGDGEREITLRNSSGVLLQAVSVNIVNGEQTIALGFNLPAQSNLKLGCQAYCGLFMGETSGFFETFDYPFTIENIISITGNDAFWITEATVYPYFYNWKLSEPSCKSLRQEVVPTETMPVPTAGFTYSNNVLEYSFLTTSQDYSNLFWNFGDNTTSTEENPIHTYPIDGEYEVIHTASNACGEETETLVINVQSSVDGLEIDGFTIYPNPITDILYIETELINSTINIIDMSGRVIYSTIIETGKSEIDFSSWAAGTYFFQLVSQEELNTIKMIKH